MTEQEMTKDQVIELLESSQSSADWSRNCDTIKKAFGGDYPDFWFQDIMQSGLMRKILARFGSDPDFHISRPDGTFEIIRNEAAK